MIRMDGSVCIRHYSLSGLKGYLFRANGQSTASDRGTQYTGKQYRKAIAKYGIQQSMNSAGGRCHDNARCESEIGRKYCTKPELEMLLIISEDLADEYEKVKSKIKPKTLAKEHIHCGKKRYDNSTAFYEDYFGPNCEKLVDAIRTYKQHNGAHKKDEHYLAELLK